MNHFSSLHDPRREHGKLHLLEDILVLAICAVICGADSFVAIEAFGHAKHDFLRRFLALPNGIPSHDTIRTVFTLFRLHVSSACPGYQFHPHRKYLPG